MNPRVKSTAFLLTFAALLGLWEGPLTVDWEAGGPTEGYYAVLFLALLLTFVAFWFRMPHLVPAMAAVEDWFDHFQPVLEGRPFWPLFNWYDQFLPGINLGIGTFVLGLPLWYYLAALLSASVEGGLWLRRRRPETQRGGAIEESPLPSTGLQQ
jgi:hypothetical protein